VATKLSQPNDECPYFFASLENIETFAATTKKTCPQCNVELLKVE